MIFGHYGRNVHIQSGVRIVRPRFISIGDNVTIGKGTDIYVHPIDSNLEKYIIRIGNNVHIGRNNIIGARKSIVLEDNVLLGPYVLIGDHSHHYENIEVPIKIQEATEGGEVRIGQDCWIGAFVFVMSNVKIGMHSIIGAHSVVNRDIPPYSVAVGVPAKVIKQYHFELKRWVRINE